MSEFIVHSVPGSPFGKAVIAALEEKGADWRLSRLAPGGLKTEPHISRHPFGRIPAIEHDDFTLYETQAILRYIDRVLPSPALTPGDARAAARMDQLLNIADWYLFLGCGATIGFNRVVGPRLIGREPDEAAIAEVMPKAEVVFAELARLLGDQPFFTGARVSLADLLVGAHLDLLSWTPEWATLTAGHPALGAWLGRMQARPSFAATTWDRLAAVAA